MKTNKILKGIMTGAGFAATTYTTLDQISQNRKHELYQELLKKMCHNHENEVLANLRKKEIVEDFLSKVNGTKDMKESLQRESSFLLDKLNNSNASLEEKSKILEAIKENQEAKSKIADTILAEAKEFSSEYTRNDLSGLIDSFLEWYKSYISTLNVEQLICLSNIIGLVWIIYILNGIVFTYYGNRLINYLDLEKRFPKLSNIIKVRSKISDKIMQVEVLYLYLVIILIIGIDLYIFMA